MLKDFEKKQPDQVKAWVIGEVINQSIILNHEQDMRILAGATEILDSIADRDWKYLNTIKTEDYSKIALKYIELQQYDQAIQIIDQKFPDYDDKVSVAVKAILMYNKVNTEINEDREEFINRVSNLTVHNELKVIR